MKNATYLSHKCIPWQATWACLAFRFKDELLTALQSPNLIQEGAYKKLTEEARYMIYMVLVYVGLAVLGSSVTAYEFFFQDSKKKTESCRNTYSENNAKARMLILKEKKSSGNQDFLEECQSFLKCFCMVKNGSKILSTATEGQINCFHGLRFLSNALIIIFHSGMIYSSMLRHAGDMEPLFEMTVSHLGLNGSCAVDTFFLISGFLNAKAFFHKYSKSGKNLSWFSFYFKRYARLTPVYTIVLGFAATLFTYTGTGILWPTYYTNPICRKDWWWHLLYINNLEESASQCLVWCWYLAADMQFYIISPIFMVTLIRWPRLGYALTLISIFGSCITSFVLTYQYKVIDGISRFPFHLNDYKNFTTKTLEYYDVVYMKPYTRISSYLIGISLEYCLHKKIINEDTERKNTIILCCGWIVTAIFIWFCVFSVYQREDILMVTAFYNGSKYLFFSCGLAWVIYLCITGQSEILNKFLSWKYFFPFSRLSYCAYLIHPLIGIRQSLQAQDFMEFSYLSLIWHFLYTFGFTYCISFIVSLLFEVPVLNLLDWFSKKKQERSSNRPHLD